MGEHIKLFLPPPHYTRAPQCYSYHHFAKHPHSSSFSPLFRWIFSLILCSEKSSGTFALSGHPSLFLPIPPVRMDHKGPLRSTAVYPLPGIGTQPEPARPPLPAQRESRRKPIRLMREDSLFH